jgi:hypothetical protein
MTTPPTFLAAFRNAIINLNHLFKKIIKGDRETDRKLNILLKYNTAQNYTTLHNCSEFVTT